MRLLKNCFVVLTISLFALNCFANEILTNTEVINLVNAGLSEDLIIAKIKASTCQFDTSTKAILNLKHNRVSEPIIQAMIESSRQPTTSATISQTQPLARGATIDPANPLDPSQMFLQNSLTSILGGKTIASPNLFFKENNKITQLIPIVAETALSTKRQNIPYYYGPSSQWHFLRGEKAVIRIKSTTPKFFTNANPSGFTLAKLTYHFKKDIRFAVEVSGVYSTLLPLKYETQTDGTFALYSEDPLEPGEYAIINGVTFYDFGIDQAE